MPPNPPPTMTTSGSRSAMVRTSLTTRLRRRVSDEAEIVDDAEAGAIDGDGCADELARTPARPFDVHDGHAAVLGLRLDLGRPVSRLLERPHHRRSLTRQERHELPAERQTLLEDDPEIGPDGEAGRVGDGID